MLSLLKTRIIGDIDIKVDVAYDKGVIEKVEFYINDQLMYTDLTEHYSWAWDKNLPFRFSHIIKVIAYNTRGNSDSDDVIVLRLF
jgi:hypothetical protein